MAALSAWAPRVLSVLRIVSGLLLLQHGTQKVLGFPPGGQGGGVDLSTVAGWSGPIELVGGVLMVVGLFSRPTAFILSGFMAVAYWMVHAPQSPYPIVNGGELAALYCFTFLYLFFAGPGPWSLDAVVRRKR
ncbi:MAG: DoxX family protein [Brevundimonas sp.]|uniref:DoxX family protein n=1 Tax=Brevundimonas sp. TaxID=1871086 RepID=UPI0011FD8AC0|nr:DoxX family protein [Brevundimonas sp.]RZJ19265.1 MAG: DoxX family protein [Brevundimonas sp.]